MHGFIHRRAAMSRDFGIVTTLEKCAEIRAHDP